MATTTKIPPEQLAPYFDRLTKRFFRDDSPEAADVEVVAPGSGDQALAHGARLIGITYDRKANSLEFELEPAPTDLRVYRPKEVWTVEEPDGFVNSVEVVRPDDTREVVHIRKLGPRRRE